MLLSICKKGVDSPCYDRLSPESCTEAGSTSLIISSSLSLLHGEICSVQLSLNVCSIFFLLLLFVSGLGFCRFICVSLSQSFLLSRLCKNSSKGCFATLEKILCGTGTFFLWVVMELSSPRVNLEKLNIKKPGVVLVWFWHAFFVFLAGFFGGFLFHDSCILGMFYWCFW